MEPTPTVELRPSLTRRLLRALVHLLERRLKGQRPECTNHCHCVVELRTQMHHARWLVGLAISALFAVLAKDCVSFLSARVTPAVAPARSGERMGVDQVPRP